MGPHWGPILESWRRKMTEKVKLGLILPGSIPVVWKASMAPTAFDGLVEEGIHEAPDNDPMF